jgi:hypothetical protein
MGTSEFIHHLSNEHGKFCARKVEQIGFTDFFSCCWSLVITNKKWDALW